MRVMVTGASGFIGRHLVRHLHEQGYEVRAAVRDMAGRATLSMLKDILVVGDIATADWIAATRDIEVVVHLAAKVHMHDADEQSWRTSNVHATERLAHIATNAGTRRFIFVSSAKVHGDRSHGLPFDESHRSQPEDAYAQSKWDAECALCTVAEQSGLETVILRPPLVYGPGVGANFFRLLDFVARGIPLPLASVDNRRSLLYVGNLVSAIVACIAHPQAAKETFIVDDGAPLSTPQLMREIAASLGRSARLWPCPPALLRGMANVLGRGRDLGRLIEDLQVNSGKIRTRLEWIAPCTRQEGLAATAAWYRSRELATLMP